MQNNFFSTMSRLYCPNWDTHDEFDDTIPQNKISGFCKV